jgi:hypothetical protein
MSSSYANRSVTMTTIGEKGEERFLSSPDEFEGAGLVAREVTISDGVVTRPSGRWTASVHHLLNWLRSDGHEFVPRPIGRTTQTEQLEFLAGRDQGWPFIAEIQSLEGAYECGVLARRLTEALARYPCPPGAVWQSATGAPVPGTQMQHGDLGPWNLLWTESGPTVCGVIDWDQAEPGDPTYDIGFLAWFLVPVMDDERARARGFSSAPDRPARLRAFARGANRDPSALLAEILRAQQEFIDRVATRGAPTDAAPIWIRLHELGFHRSAGADLEFGRDLVCAVTNATWCARR